ncbi:MAG: transposase, partial [Lachnospiraceae bacterium]|nr:transposase [Lachnospiraceae bacterium]
MYGRINYISFVDSTTLDVCDNHRIQQNRVFRGTAMRGKAL